MRRGILAQNCMDVCFTAAQRFDQAGRGVLPFLWQLPQQRFDGCRQKTSAPPEREEQQRRQGQRDQRQKNPPTIQHRAENTAPESVENAPGQKGQVDRQFQQPVQSDRGDGFGGGHSGPSHQQIDLGWFAAELGTGREQADRRPNQPIDGHAAKREADAHSPQEQPPAVGKEQRNSAVDRHINQKGSRADAP